MILQTKIFYCPADSTTALTTMEEKINDFLKQYNESDIEGIVYELYANNLYAFISYIIIEESIENKVIRIVKEDKLI